MSLTNDNILYYDYEETSGVTVNDRSGNNNNGTLASADLRTTSAKVGDGALEFNGDDEDFNTGFQPFSGETPSFSVGCWVYIDSVQSEQNLRIISFAADADNGFNLAIDDRSDRKRFAFRVNKAGTSYNFRTNDLFYSPDTWYFVVGSFNASTNTTTLTINGSDYTESDGGSVLGATTMYLASTSAAGFFAGRIDDTFYYERVLTNQEKDDLYNNGDGFNPYDTDSPTVTTQAVTSIDKTSATANGNVTDLGEETEVEAGHQYREDGESTWINTATQTVTATGAYTTSLTGLEPDQKYEVRSRITWDSGAEEVFGSIVEFDTLPLDSPTVTSNAATSITDTSATLNGDLTSLGDYEDVDVFFEWREGTEGAWTETGKVNRDSTGTFNASISSLTPDTLHQFRAVVEYDTTKRVEGATLEFTTLEVSVGPTVTTDAVTEISLTKATFNGELTDLDGETAVDVAFDFRVVGAGSWIRTATEELTALGTFDFNQTGLTQGTDYEVRAVVIYDTDQENFGATVPFTTDVQTTYNPLKVRNDGDWRRVS
jgi:hypothetical protein